MMTLRLPVSSLIRTDSTFVRTTQLDNHYVVNDIELTLDCRPRHRFLEPIHNVKDGARKLLPRRTADPVSSSLETLCCHYAGKPAVVVEPVGIEPTTSSLQS